jgi:hypothetical protein
VAKATVEEPYSLLSIAASSGMLASEAAKVRHASSDDYLDYHWRRPAEMIHEPVMNPPMNANECACVEDRKQDGEG